MAKSWSDVEQSEAYQNLSDTEKQELKQEYFSNVTQKSPVYLNASPEDRITYEEGFLGYSPTKEGEVISFGTSKKREAALKRHNLIPSIGQFAGGMGGGVIGGFFGHPYLGAMAGGTGGRMAGRGVQELIDIPERQRLEKEGMVFPNRGKLALNELSTTATTEALTAPLGFGLGKLGKGIVKTFIPKTVSERGFKEGFKGMLNPEYYKEGIPKQIATRMYNLFSKTQNKFGQAIDDILSQPKYQNFKINLNDVKINLRSSLKSLGIDSVQDIDKLDLSRRDKDIIMRELRGVVNLEKTASTPKNLWNIRRNLDKVVYGKSWKPEAEEVLNAMRKSLNSPLRNLGGDVSQAFDEYSVLMDKSSLINFTDDIIKYKTTGETFTMPKTETFIKTLMSPEKTGLREFITRLDPELAKDMFDLSSAKVLGRQSIPGSPYQTLFGKFIQPKKIAQSAEFFQRPSIDLIKKSFGRMIPITGTNLRTEE